MRQRVVWHYCLGVRAWNILREGRIDPAPGLLPETERPLVWFSAHPRWEPTASKEIVLNGVKRVLTLPEMTELTGGLWRFGRSSHGLLNWRALQYIARLSSETARTLRVIAQETGAEAAWWYGCLEPVPLEQLVIQRLHDAHGRWMPR